MAPRRRAATALAGSACLVLALAVVAASLPHQAEAQTATSWLQVFNMLLKPRSCSTNGKVLAVCRRDPCAVTSCPKGFRCKADYCGACTGMCEADPEADEAEKAAALAAPTCEVTGQPGKKAVRPQCSTPMCTFMQCGQGMACVNDFCGGCTGTCVNSTETMGECICDGGEGGKEDSFSFRAFALRLLFPAHEKIKNPATPKQNKTATGAIKPSIQGSSLASVTSCRAGEYMSGSGCRQCIPGSVSQAGAVECTMCQMGEYANIATNTCDKCAVGYASAALRATSCSPCNGGRYSDKEGSVMCSACKDGFTTPRDKQPHTSCVVAAPEPKTLEEAKNATAAAKKSAEASVEEMRAMDDSKFEELFEDLDDKADAVLGGDGKADGGKGGAAARADAVEEKAAAAALP